MADLYMDIGNVLYDLNVSVKPNIIWTFVAHVEVRF